MMIATTVIHASGMVIALHLLKVTHAERWGRASVWTRLTVIAALVLIMFVACVIEAAGWGAVYVGLGAIDGLEPAMYFSMVTYTTLGYGDVVLEGQWRLLGAFQAANGIIMFGWTTAMIVTAVHRVYFTDRST
jgi:hypothetical protein